MMITTLKMQSAPRWLAILGAALLMQSAMAADGKPRVSMQTSMGLIVLEVEPARAPITVKNFLEYVKAGHYNGTIFHRVIPGFVVQGGGYSDKLIEKPTRPAIFNESGNGLSNRNGTLAMARTNDPHTATSQFYINLADNVSLDPQPGRWGYAVFGRVVQGLEIMQKMGDAPTGTVGSLDDTPLKPIMIEKMELVE